MDATKYWNDVFSAYNKVSRTPVNTDLTAYVTEKAIAGIFHELALEEQKIRQDPAARVTELLKSICTTVRFTDTPRRFGRHFVSPPVLLVQRKRHAERVCCYRQ